MNWKIESKSRCVSFHVYHRSLCEEKRRKTFAAEQDKMALHLRNHAALALLPGPRLRVGNQLQENDLQPPTVGRVEHCEVLVSTHTFEDTHTQAPASRHTLAAADSKAAPLPPRDNARRPVTRHGHCHIGMLWLQKTRRRSRRINKTGGRNG